MREAGDRRAALARGPGRGVLLAAQGWRCDKALPTAAPYRSPTLAQAWDVKRPPGRRSPAAGALPSLLPRLAVPVGSSRSLNRSPCLGASPRAEGRGGHRGRRCRPQQPRRPRANPVPLPASSPWGCRQPAPGRPASLPVDIMVWFIVQCD